MDLRGCSLLKETDVTREQLLHLISLAAQVREEKRVSQIPRRLLATVGDNPAGGRP